MTVSVYKGSIMKARLRLKDNYCYLLSPFIAALVLLIAFAIGGVFPFGDNTVIYYDMAQRFVPNFYHIWDAMHDGDVALWFNWYSGLGVNDAADASFSLFWAVLAVIPRRLIGKAMSLYVVMFFSLSAFTSSLFLRKIEKTSQFITTVLSLCYAFCGYSVMYYTNTWQDSVVLFPLLMLSMLELFNNGKRLPYILLVFLNIMCSYYVFVLSLIFVFFSGYAYLALVCENCKKKRAALDLGASTVCGILLSAFALVPKLAQTLQSGRFTEKSGFDFSSVIRQYVDIAGTAHCKYPEKVTMLFLTALPIALIILGLFGKKSGKKENCFYLFNIALMVVPLVCEGTNLLMHLGDYKYFPMRAGFALSFAVIWAGGHYSKFIKSANTTDSGTLKSKPAAFVSTLICVGIFAVAYILIKLTNSRLDGEFSVAWSIPLLVAVYALIIGLSGRRYDYRAVIGGVIAEALAVSMLFVPYWQTSHNVKEQSPAYIQSSQSISKKLSVGESKTQRVKTIGTTLNCNYGTIMKRATVSDWTHLIPPSVNDGLSALGYSGDFTRLHDSGGTAFTDALLGVTNVLSVKDESPALYEELESKGGYNYYKCKYTIPYGIVVDKSILDIDVNGSDWKELNNELYTCLTGDTSPIVTDSGLRLIEQNDSIERYSFVAKKDTVAYFNLKGASKVVIEVNGKKLTVPSIDQEKNKKYPGRFNRTLICLGEFEENEQVEIKLYLKNGKFEDKADFRQNDFGSNDNRNQNYFVEVALLDLGKLKAACDKYSEENNTVAENYSLCTTASSSGEDNVLLLALQYNGCWSATINGRDSGVDSVMGFLSAVRLDDGQNDISMRFTPIGFRTGLVVSALGIILFALLALTKRCNGKFVGALSRGVYLIYGLSFFFGLAVIYAVPIGMRIISLMNLSI